MPHSEIPSHCEKAIDELLLLLKGRLTSRGKKVKDSYSIEALVSIKDIGEWKILVLLGVLYSRWGITHITTEVRHSLQEQFEPVSRLMKHRKEDFNRILNGFKDCSTPRSEMVQHDGSFAEWPLAKPQTPLKFLDYQYRFVQAYVENSPDTRLDAMVQRIKDFRLWGLQIMYHEVNSEPSEVDNERELRRDLAELAQKTIRTGNSKLSSNPPHHSKKISSDTADKRLGSSESRPREVIPQRETSSARASATRTLRSSPRMSEEPQERPRKKRKANRELSEPSRGRSKERYDPVLDAPDIFLRALRGHKGAGRTRDSPICFGSNKKEFHRLQRILVEQRPVLKAVIKVNCRGSCSVICCFDTSHEQKWFKVALSAWMRYGDRDQQDQATRTPKQSFQRTTPRPFLEENGRQVFHIDPAGIVKDGEVSIFMRHRTPVESLRGSYRSDEDLLKDVPENIRGDVGRRLRKVTDGGSISYGGRRSMTPICRSRMTTTEGDENDMIC